MQSDLRSMCSTTHRPERRSAVCAATATADRNAAEVPSPALSRASRASAMVAGVASTTVVVRSSDSSPLPGGLPDLLGGALAIQLYRANAIPRRLILDSGPRCAGTRRMC